MGRRQTRLSMISQNRGISARRRPGAVACRNSWSGAITGPRAGVQLFGQRQKRPVATQVDLRPHQ
jgi:hypothetical protein